MNRPLLRAIVGVVCVIVTFLAALSHQDNVFCLLLIAVGSVIACDSVWRLEDKP